MGEEGGLFPGKKKIKKSAPHKTFRPGKWIGQLFFGGGPRYFARFLPQRKKGGDTTSNCVHGDEDPSKKKKKKKVFVIQEDRRPIWEVYIRGL